MWTGSRTGAGNASFLKFVTLSKKNSEEHDFIEKNQVDQILRASVHQKQNQEIVIDYDPNFR